MAPKVIEEDIDPVEEDIDHLIKFLNDAKARGYPIPGGESNSEMLHAVGRLALTECKDVRHKWQHAMIECFAESVYGIRDEMNSELAKMSYTRDNSDIIKASLETARDQASETFDSKKVSLEEKKCVLTEKKNALVIAEEELEDLEDKLGESTSVLEDLQNAHTLLLANMDDLTSLKSTNDGDASERVLAGLTLYGAEDGILQGAPAVFKKTPEARGGFDQTILDYCDKFFVEHRDILQSKVSAAQTVVTNETVVKDASEVRKEKALDERIHATEDVTIVSTEKTEASHKLKQCEKDITAHVRMSKDVGHSIVKLEGHLRQFGLAVRLFELLQSRETKKLEPVVDCDVVSEAVEVTQKESCEATEEEKLIQVDEVKELELDQPVSVDVTEEIKEMEQPVDGVQTIELQQIVGQEIEVGHLNAVEPTDQVDTAIAEKEKLVEVNNDVEWGVLNSEMFQF